MAEYAFLWKGKDPHGRLRGVRVPAENAQISKELLARAGWTDLELLKDEIASSEALRIEPADWIKEGFDEFHTPEKEVELIEGKAPGLVAQTWVGIKQSIPTILLSAALLGWGIYSHRTWPVIIGALGLAFGFLLTPAIHFFFSLFSRSSREYSRLNTAKVWGRWNEVLGCVERLRKKDRLTGVGVPEIELARCRAQAFAALGRLDEGVTEFKRYEHSPNIERWFYLSLLSSVYDTGKSYEKALEIRKQAAAEKPDHSAVWIDLAYGSVRGLNRPAEAREYLAKAEALEISGLGKAYLPFVRGIICWREGKMAEAKQHLERALTSFQPWTHNELAEGLILLTKSYLCAVAGSLGNSSEAKALYRETEKFLVANKEEELLRACGNALPMSR